MGNKTIQNGFDHEINNAASAMGLALKNMAKNLSIFYKQYERLKRQKSIYEKCIECIPSEKHQKEEQGV